jgi:hypothetical protein
MRCLVACLKLLIVTRPPQLELICFLMKNHAVSLSWIVFIRCLGKRKGDFLEIRSIFYYWPVWPFFASLFKDRRSKYWLASWLVQTCRYSKGAGANLFHKRKKDQTKEDQTKEGQEATSERGSNERRAGGHVGKTLMQNNLVPVGDLNLCSCAALSHSLVELAS